MSKKKKQITNQINSQAINNIKTSFLNILKKNWKQLLFLAILAFIAYCNSFRGEFLSDDIEAILNNKNIGNLLYYLRTQPLTFMRYLVYYFTQKINGVDPFAFKIMNFSFHLMTVLAVYVLILIVYTPLVALLTACLFAVHPILTETGNWISGGVHAQYVFFIILSFIFYLLSKKNSWMLKYYILSIILYLLGILTTEKAIVLFPILFLYEISFDNLKKTWKRLLPFASIAFLWVILFLSFSRIGDRILALETGHYQTGKFYNPLTQIPTAISSYLRLIFWPDGLTLYHSEMTFDMTKYIIMITVTLSFFAFLIWAWKKNKNFFFWGSFFIASLLPMLTPLRVAWIVAERYVYLGSLGIFVIFVLLITKIVKDKKVLYIIMAIIIIALTTRTLIRNKDWQNQDTLWLSAAKTSPSSSQNHNNLGDLYARQGDYQKAIEEFKKAIEIKPNYGDAYHNLANIYHQIGDNEQAIENYQKALSFNPNLWQSYQNLAATYFEKEDFAKSLEYMSKAIQINPQGEELYINTSIIYIKLNENEKAKEVIQKALVINPQSERAQQLLSQITK